MAYRRRTRRRTTRKTRYAKKRARVKSRQVYRTNVTKPKRAVVKKFANFVGKTTFMKAVKTRRRKRRTRRRR